MKRVVSRPTDQIPEGDSLVDGIRECSKALVLLRHFLYINGWDSIPDPMPPVCKIECILENLAKKHLICST